MLKVNEVILTIQGEGTRAGLPCILVRLAGCNLRCRWCDTRYAWTEGRERDVDDVLREVCGLGCRRVELTGGEPLLQAEAAELLRRLCDEGMEVLLETNGSLDLSVVDGRVVRIMDIKCPASGEAGAMRWENVAFLSPRDEVKFVLADAEDYRYARSVILEHKLLEKCAVLLSPVMGGAPAGLEPAQLAEWMLADGLDARLNLQLHRVIWPTRERGV